MVVSGDHSASTDATPTLYHVKWYCSAIPYQTALELGLGASELRVRTLSENELKTSPEVGELSPRRVVPVLDLGGGRGVMCESGAILLYLLETYDKSNALGPAPGSPLRAHFLQGVVYGVTECYKAASELFQAVCLVDKKDQDSERIAWLKKRFDEVVLGHLSRTLGHGKMFYLGDSFSAVDIVMGYSLMTADFMKSGLLDGNDTNEAVKQYWERLKGRDTYKQLFTLEEEEIKEMQEMQDRALTVS